MGLDEVPSAETPQVVKKRTRASVACNNCRIKRSKCAKNQLECEMRQDGKRQRPSSRMQVEALTERVKMLENLLSMSKEPADQASPTAPQSLHVFHGPTPASTSAPLAELGEASTVLGCPSSEGSDLDWSLAENLLFSFDEGNTLHGSVTDGVVSTSILVWTPNDGIGKDTAATDASFGFPPPPVEMPTPVETERAVLEGEPAKRRRASVASPEPLGSCVSSRSRPGSPGSSIPESLVEHLLYMYFRKFQTILEIVDETAFRAGMAPDPQGVPPVRDSLLLAMLAAGARFLDDPVLIKQCTSPSGECVFVPRAKALLEPEIGQADAMTVQALLILGELETSAGNEMTGCMYSGIGRPLTIKNMELQLSRMIAKFSRQSASKVVDSSKELIHESLLDLMELARDAVDMLVASIGLKISLDR
ncbi:hypothetical protein ACRE_081420 [Hapsidospora chrysogenum ATCC 11550]|uniref:Zn(2)-C6 fungal-type domain-containing protein n=1 Tax=Hapsidospora chrysogenum (strain ATCC 11550 / CBS 779.69 / DSM 880 / IAM 14645 / JCM 23072 / IMI 49137) TaxID=857340 RepID=A0A086SVM4_HAPC1|nr:hypothetical protein ACRE_081420 [Hapsidospora chrysogenum ATCC 11550]